MAFADFVRDPQTLGARVAVVAAIALAISACGGGDGTSPPNQDDGPPSVATFCSIPEADIVSGGVARGGIPALLNPPFLAPDHEDVGYLREFDRVIGLEIAGEFFTIPHNILWHHEILNFEHSGVKLAITYCPLTGSSMVFDRSTIEGRDFGVSGLVYKNNLIMFDRRQDGGQESWFPQFLRGARCGPRDGEALPMYPSIEMRWDAWESLHPTTTVVSGVLGIDRDYEFYPYGDYAVLNNGETVFPQGTHDPRRPPKERVLGIPRDDGFGMAFPFTLLNDLGDKAVVHDDVQGTRSIVVFWSTDAAAAVAFVPRVNGQALTFEARDDGFFDVENGSEWTLQGTAISGPLSGSVLELVPDAFVSFWFAWATFHPSTGLFGTP